MRARGGSKDYRKKSHNTPEHQRHNQGHHQRPQPTGGKQRGAVESVRVAHLELPGRGGHLPLAALGEGQHAEEVGLARRQVGQHGLQLVADVDDGVVGLRDVHVGLPDADAIAGERFLGDAGRDVAPGDADRGGVDAEDLDGGGRLLGPQLEGSLQEAFALGTRAWGTQTNRE